MKKIRLTYMISSLSMSTLLIASGCTNVAQPTFNQDAIISVNVSKAQKEFITSDKAYSGVIKPSEEIKIIPKMAGKVTELPIDVGMKVEKGQVLLKLDDKELRNSVKKASAAESAAKANIQSAEMGQKSGVLQSESGVVQAKGSMVQAQNSMIQTQDNVTKTENAVKQADNAVKDSELALKKTQQVLTDATTNHDRMKQLYAESLISQADFEKSESALVTAQASYDSSKIANDNAITSLATAKKANETAKQAYDNADKGYQNASEGFKKAQEQVDNLKNSASIEASKEAWKQAKVAVDIANDMLEDSVIKSPISGMIGMKNTDIGEMISTQSPALVVVDLEKVKALTYIPATDINNIKQGDRVQAKIISSNFVTQGTVKTISPIDENGDGYPVEIEISNPDLSLKSGMLVDLQFVPDDAVEGILIPASAVINEKGKSYVYVTNDNHPKRQEIEINEKKGSMVIVTKGISEDDLVITNNLPLLSSDVTITYEF
ncbi:efflux RND transporter periplasmic adaptor subunit [Peribacillus loiseleuriae]|uniref:efflux RND transporter periplasmic adaptor subunit n=1 Tax=Peribacillus loiseleuriae TaxID=1679170 RepID=UPI0038037E77